MRAHSKVSARLALLALPAILLLACCSANRQSVRDEPVVLEDRGVATVPEPTPQPTSVSRTGVPILMDLPVIGFLFRRTTVVR